VSSGPYLDVDTGEEESEGLKEGRIMQEKACLGRGEGRQDGRAIKKAGRGGGAGTQAHKIPHLPEQDEGECP